MVLICTASMANDFVYVFICLMAIHMHLLLYSSCCTLLPIIMVYCNILPDPLWVKNLLPHRLRMLQAVSFQLSLISEIASAAQNHVIPRACPFLGWPTSKWYWMMQKIKAWLSWPNSCPNAEGQSSYGAMRKVSDNCY